MRLATRVSCAVLSAALFSQLTACGTLFYPDRRGQIDGRVDPAIVAFDAIGLLFYIIPGLIAFGVDFATGAIYLPDAKYSVAPEKLKDAVSEDGSVDKAKLKAILERETGRSLPLDDPRLIQRSGSLQQLASLGLRPEA
ncbi:polyribonucleotide nucleotidyltransferase [Pseudomonas sp. NY15437]|uniref:polyribonucleotide nucleotidyltransferase n=1 Tax=unclassified Pseudomonas TaxID=196821 RepID=UPI00223B446E|nr:polyribonucleotide nucleotidyltransferase [Pseudomonas sp. GCEP-101]